MPEGERNDVLIHCSNFYSHFQDNMWINGFHNQTTHNPCGTRGSLLPNQRHLGGDEQGLRHSAFEVACRWWHDNQ